MKILFIFLIAICSLFMVSCQRQNTDEISLYKEYEQAKKNAINLDNYTKSESINLEFHISDQIINVGANTILKYDKDEKELWSYEIGLNKIPKMTQAFFDDNRLYIHTKNDDVYLPTPTSFITPNKLEITKEATFKHLLSVNESLVDANRELTYILDGATTIDGIETIFRHLNGNIQINDIQKSDVKVIATIDKKGYLLNRTIELNTVAQIVYNGQQQSCNLKYVDYIDYSRFSTTVVDKPNSESYKYYRPVEFNELLNILTNSLP